MLRSSTGNSNFLSPEVRAICSAQLLRPASWRDVESNGVTTGGEANVKNVFALRNALEFQIGWRACIHQGLRLVT